MQKAYPYAMVLSFWELTQPQNQFIQPQNRLLSRIAAIFYLLA